MPVINTNIASLIAQNNLAKTQNALQTSMQRLSSGLRINSAKDDAAGQAIANRMTTQINGLNQAARNANDAISLSQTADSALTEMTNNMQRIRELAVQAANSTNSSSDRAALDQEVQQRLAEIDRIASQTTFNGQHVLDGSFGTAQFQVGANVGDTINVDLSSSLKSNAIGAYVNQSSTYVATTPTTSTQTGGAFTATAKTPDPLSFTGVDTTSALAANTLEINGTTIQASSQYAGAANGQDANSAYAKAAAINGSDINGVTAEATNVVTLPANTAGTAGTSDFLQFSDTGTNADATISYTLTINGQAVLTASGDTSIDQAVTAINSFTDTTGVSASNTGSGLQLTAADGRTINLEEQYTTTADTTGTGVSTIDTAFGQYVSTAGAATSSDQTYSYGGQLSLLSSAAVTLTGTDSVINSIGQAASASAGSYVINTQNSLSGQDVKTVADANNVILSVDAALTAVNNLSSTFGAIQNRFDSVIASTQSTSQNLTAARSRIQDADFAAETAALTRAQILQQAGTAMVAQANALPNSVLTLLR